MKKGAKKTSTKKKVKKASTKKPRKKTTKKAIKKRVTSKRTESKLVEHTLALQKHNLNLIEKVEGLTGRIDAMLQLFESAADALAQKELQVREEDQNTKKMLERLDLLFEQNKIIAKGITLVHDKRQEGPRGPPPILEPLPPPRKEPPQMSMGPEEPPQFPEPREEFPERPFSGENALAMQRPKETPQYGPPLQKPGIPMLPPPNIAQKTPSNLQGYQRSIASQDTEEQQ